MPVEEIRVAKPSPYEAVDVTASATLKETHKKFGGWMKELAGIVHSYYSAEIKGSWQALWTVATKCFSAGYHGYSLDKTIEIARALADEFNIPTEVDIEKLASEAWELGCRYGERRAKRPKTTK
ncbi:MAG: hypothetical protein B6U76_06560 [Desulfurococcales archaeon ex4484_217_2]|nr:MAG: hypothetical protein B6U76_06560 [Desulfurococcales archaeon ex4484_217_2]